MREGHPGKQTPRRARRCPQGQPAAITTSQHAGKRAIFSKPSSHGAGRCFASFTSGLLAGAQVKVSDIQAIL